jgi:curved DNA-binding protein CbpA
MGLRAHAKLLGIETTAGRAQVIDAFREKVKSAHPDGGGDPAAFRLLIEARDAMLTRGED